MASRENTAIHVALILLVMTTIAGAVCAFMFSSQAKTKVGEANTALRKMNEAEMKNRANYYKVQMLKYMIGGVGVSKADVDALSSSVTDDQVKDVHDMETAFKKFIKDYGHGLNPDSITYSNLPANLLAALKQRNETNTTHQTRVDALVSEKAAIEDTAAKNVASAETRATKAETDLDGERKAFNVSRSEHTKNSQVLAAANAAAQKRMKDENIKIATQLVGVTKEKQQTDQLNEEFRRIKAMESRETFETPDGRITGVDLIEKVAYINLGSIDGLRTGITFSVYPPKSVGVTRKKDEIKAEIEVIEVIDERFARCKILSQGSIREPIEPMDQIHTPAWRPGRKIHFALVGALDVDGDGSPDNDTIKSLIRQNNGVIDAEVGLDGKKVGKITLETRYIVKGATIDKLVTGKDYRAFMDEARYHGVQPITVGEFLSYMGWSNQVRTVALGRAARSDDFREKRALQTSDQPQQNFRPRQPPKRGKKGAF